jgi:hypothetical protein
MNKIIMLAAVAIAVAFIPVKVAAFMPTNGETNKIGNLILSVSGTVKTQNTLNTNKMTVSTMSFNEKYVYELISYAVANVQTYTIYTNYLNATNLPADGYIAFSPNFQLNNVANNSPNTFIYGLFYVTNKSGFYYPLSGYDNNGQFYSYIELDSYLDYVTGAVTNDFDFDFGYFTSDIGSYGVSGKTGNGSGISTSTALLYIHDNPYAYDDLDYADTFDGTENNYYGQSFYNNYVIEIRGIVTGRTTLKNFTPTGASFSLTGSGNFVEAGNTFAGVLTGGSARLYP